MGTATDSNHTVSLFLDIAFELCGDSDFVGMCPDTNFPANLDIDRG